MPTSASAGSEIETGRDIVGASVRGHYESSLGVRRGGRPTKFGSRIVGRLTRPPRSASGLAVYVAQRPLAPFCETPRLMAMPIRLEKIDKRLREVTEIRHQIRAETLECDLW